MKTNVFFEYDSTFFGDKEGERKPIYCPEEMNCNDQGCEAKHDNKNVMCMFQKIVVLHGLDLNLPLNT